MNGHILMKYINITHYNTRSTGQDDIFNVVGSKVKSRSRTIFSQNALFWRFAVEDH